ncbi:hypothetical protein CRYUN_Cryun01aG0259400 [Craigia yunnanensis]
MASLLSLKSAIFDREEKKEFRLLSTLYPILLLLHYQAHIRGLNAYDRHKKFLNDYVGFYGKEKSTDVKLPVKTDHDTLREGSEKNVGSKGIAYKIVSGRFGFALFPSANQYEDYLGCCVFSLPEIIFIRSEEDDMNPSWEQRLVKCYYDKFLKTHLRYCIADMSQYKSGKIGLRWRTEKEVISGKGQFICGNKHCNEKDDLASYEASVNFSYFEAGENKQAFVKLVTCERCAEKLYYKKRKETEELDRKQKKVST